MVYGEVVNLTNGGGAIADNKEELFQALEDMMVKLNTTPDQLFFHITITGWSAGDMFTLKDEFETVYSSYNDMIEFKSKVAADEIGWPWDDSVVDVISMDISDHHYGNPMEMLNDVNRAIREWKENTENNYMRNGKPIEGIFDTDVI